MERKYILFYAMAQHGSYEDAVAAASALAARWPKDEVTLYNRACVHALAAGTIKSNAAVTERYQVSAGALLRQADSVSSLSADNLSKDPDLDSLRHREDFRALLKKRDAKQPKLGISALAVVGLEWIMARKRAK